eukprot:763745-Hanusia_phi.AAC.2
MHINTDGSESTLLSIYELVSENEEEGSVSEKKAPSADRFSIPSTALSLPPRSFLSSCNVLTVAAVGLGTVHGSSRSS